MHPSMTGEEQRKRLGPLTAGANKKTDVHTSAPQNRKRKKKPNSADEQEKTNHVECNSGLRQWQARTLPGGHL